MSFSPLMEYACLSKTNSVHAHKLRKQGDRTLFNEGKFPIKWQAGDEESEAISQEGPLCVVYDEKLWPDTVAIDAITTDDNLNSACQMEEDEMTAFMAVHQLVKKDEGSQPKVLKFTDVLQQIRERGFRNFRSADWEAFIALRLQCCFACSCYTVFTLLLGLLPLHDFILVFGLLLLYCFCIVA